MLKKFQAALQWFQSDNRKSKSGPADEKQPPRLKWVELVAIVVTLALGGAVADAQQKGKIPRLGMLSPESDSGVCPEGFRQGMRQLNYVDGQNIVIEFRSGESKPDRIREVAADIVRSAPDVIWTHGFVAILAVKQATTTIPIVVGVSRNLVEMGIVASLARPGGNIQ